MGLITLSWLPWLIAHKRKGTISVASPKVAMASKASTATVTVASIFTKNLAIVNLPLLI
jgi:hypothetical protein